MAKGDKEEPDRVFTRLTLTIPAKTMQAFEREMRVEGIEASSDTRRMPCAKTVLALIEAYGEGRVAIVAKTVGGKRAVKASAYVEAHRNGA